MVPDPVHYAVCQHDSPGVSCRDGNWLKGLADWAHVGLVCASGLAGHSPDGSGGEVGVTEGVVHAHIRTHGADFVPKPVLSQLLGKPSSSIWRDLVGVDKYFALALPGCGGGAWHGGPVVLGGGRARCPGPGTLGCRLSVHSD